MNAERRSPGRLASVALAFLGAAAVLAPAGCSDSLATGAYRGRALLRVQGKIIVDAASAGAFGALDNLRVAVFWNGDAAIVDPDAATVVSQEVSVRGSFPADVEVTLFQPAPEAVLRAMDGRPGKLGLAVILLYVDVDGDGAWDRGDEPIVGGAQGVALVYATEAQELSSGGSLAVGYNVVDASHIVVDAPHEDSLPEGDPEDEGGHWLDRVQLDATPERVDLVLTNDLLSIVPDLDGDGQWGDWGDPCEPLREMAEHTEDEHEREMLLEEHRFCVESHERIERLPPDVAECAFYFDGIAFEEDPSMRLRELNEYLECIHRIDERAGDPGWTEQACAFLCEAPPPEPGEVFAERLRRACEACPFPGSCGHAFVEVLDAWTHDRQVQALEEYLGCAAAFSEPIPEPGWWDEPCGAYAWYRDELPPGDGERAYVEEVEGLCHEVAGRQEPPPQ